MEINLDELRVRRKALSVSQREMNKLCKFSEKIYGLIERKKMVPTKEHVEAIRCVLEKTPVPEKAASKVIAKDVRVKRATKTPPAEGDEVTILPGVTFIDGVWEGSLAHLNLLKMVTRQRVGRKVTATELQDIKLSMKGRLLSSMLDAIDAGTNGQVLDA